MIHLFRAVLALFTHVCGCVVLLIKCYLVLTFPPRSQNGLQVVCLGLIADQKRANLGGLVTCEHTHLRSNLHKLVGNILLGYPHLEIL